MWMLAANTSTGGHGPAASLCLLAFASNSEAEPVRHANMTDTGRTLAGRDATGSMETKAKAKGKAKGKGLVCFHKVRSGEGPLQAAQPRGLSIADDAGCSNTPSGKKVSRFLGTSMPSHQ